MGSTWLETLYNIYPVSLDPTEGREQRGNRPVLGGLRLPGCRGGGTGIRQDGLDSHGNARW